MRTKPMCSARPSLWWSPAPFDQLPLGAAEGEEGLQLELAELARQLTQAQVRWVPACIAAAPHESKGKPKIRPAEPNSKRREINDLPLSTRAVAGDPNRHFLHRSQGDPHRSAGLDQDVPDTVACAQPMNARLVNSRPLSGRTDRPRSGTSAPAAAGPLIAEPAWILKDYPVDAMSSTS